MCHFRTIDIARFRPDRNPSERLYKIWGNCIQRNRVVRIFNYQRVIMNLNSTKSQRIQGVTCKCKGRRVQVPPAYLIPICRHLTLLKVSMYNFTWWKQSTNKLIQSLIFYLQGILCHITHNNQEKEKLRHFILGVGLQAGQNGPASKPNNDCNLQICYVKISFPFACESFLIVAWKGWIL